MTDNWPPSEEELKEFLGIAATYFGPETYLDSIDELKELVQQPREQQDADLLRFKELLRGFLEHGTAPLGGRLITALEGAVDGAEPMFCRRAWVELFPREPIPGPVPGPFHALLTILHCYYDPDEYGDIEDLKSLVTLPEGHGGAYLGQLKDDLARVLRGDLHEHTARLIRTVGGRAAGGELNENKIARAVWHELYPWTPLPDDILPEDTPPIGVRRPEDG